MNENTDIDSTILKAIIKGDSNSFEILFRKYYQELCNYGMGILGNAENAEDVVQDVFVYLWENRQRINITTSLKSYLYQSVRNGALKIIRTHALEQRHTSRLTEYMEYLEKSRFSEDELDKLQKIEQAIDELPPQCKKVFLMNLMDNKSYKQIADELEISLNTVKTHVSKAYRIIREKTRNFKNLSLLIWLCFKKDCKTHQ